MKWRSLELGLRLANELFLMHHCHEKKMSESEENLSYQGKKKITGSIIFMSVKAKSDNERETK